MFKRLLDLAQTFAEGWLFVTQLYNLMTVQRNKKQMYWALARCSAIKLLGGNCEQANEISCGAHWTDLLKNSWKFLLTLIGYTLLLFNYEHPKKGTF